MAFMQHLRITTLLAASFISLAGTSQRTHAADSEKPRAAQLRAAITRSVPLLEAGAQGSMEKRSRCFTCHSQALPIMALTTVANRGIGISFTNLRAQLEFTAAFLTRNREVLQQGKGLGGQVNTAGSAMEALAAGAWPPDEITAAAAEYLLLWQKNFPHWRPSSRRPPTQASRFTATYLALLGLKNFGTAAQADRIKTRVQAAQDWLLATAATDTEDHVFRLRALAVSEARTAIGPAVQDLLRLQRADGGWGQLPALPSDAYATGTALAALHQAGGLPTDDPAFAKGLQFLLAAQLADGSWHVATRSKPIQTYFESGYPHGKDQFISISAASWATIALALALPETKPADRPATGE